MERLESLNTRIRIPGTQEGKGRIRTTLHETLENRRECLRRNNEGSRETADRENIQATNHESMYIQIQQQYGMTQEVNRREKVNPPIIEEKSPRIRKSHTSKKMATHQEKAENSKQENRSPPGGGLEGTDEYRCPHGSQEYGVSNGRPAQFNRGTSAPGAGGDSRSRQSGATPARDPLTLYRLYKKEPVIHSEPRHRITLTLATVVVFIIWTFMITVTHIIIMLTGFILINCKTIMKPSVTPDQA